MKRELTLQKNNPVITAAFNLLREIELATQIDQPVNVFIAGGVAVSFYDNERKTKDLDVEFSKKILFAGEIEVFSPSGELELFLDTNYSSAFSFLHENYLEDSIHVEPLVNLKWLIPFVLSPEDLVMSKLSRFAENDQHDIANLIMGGWVDSSVLIQKCQEAIAYYIGNKTFLNHNINDVCQLASYVEQNPEFAESYTGQSGFFDLLANTNPGSA